MNLLRLPCSFVHWPSSQFFYLLTVISQDTNSNTIIKCNDIENGIRRAFHLDTMLQVFNNHRVFASLRIPDRWIYWLCFLAALAQHWNDSNSFRIAQQTEWEVQLMRIPRFVVANVSSYKKAITSHRTKWFLSGSVLLPSPQDTSRELNKEFRANRVIEFYAPYRFPITILKLQMRCLILWIVHGLHIWVHVKPDWLFTV